MALNETHENLLDGYFNFLFDEISESAPPDVVLAAYEVIEIIAQAALDPAIEEKERINEIHSKWDSEFNRYDINAAILQIAKILEHKYPQNRVKSSSDSYQQFVPESVVFSIRRDDIADESKEVITLKDGTRIERNSIFVQFEPEHYPEFAYLAYEPEGLLSLTSRGPATRTDVVKYIQARTKLEIDKVQQSSSILFSELQPNVEYLSEGLLGNIDSKNRSFIEQSLSKMQEFARTNSVLVKAILLRLSHLFYRRNELTQKRNENDLDYIARMLLLISKEISANLTKYDGEFKEDEQKLVEFSQQQKKLSEDISAKRAALAEIKKHAKEKFWGEALKQQKLLSSECEGQWGSLVASEANLSSLNKIFRKFLPEKEILSTIKQYKILSAEVSRLESASHAIQAEKFKIAEKRKTQSEKRAASAQQKEWLKCLRRGDFVKADQVWSLSEAKSADSYVAKRDILPARGKNPYFDVNAQDEFGRTALFYALRQGNYHLAYKEAKSADSYVAKRDILPARGKNPYFDVNAQDEFGRTALFYALRHGNYLLAYKLAVFHEADYRGISFNSWPDVKIALNPLSGISRHNAWMKVIENEVWQDLRNLVSGLSSETFDAISNRYAADHSVLFSDTYYKFLNQIKVDFRCFLRGIVVNKAYNLGRFNNIFTVLNQKELFTKLFEEARNEALTSLNIFLEGQNIRTLNDIKQKFEHLKEIDLFNAKIEEHLASLDAELNTRLTWYGSEAARLQIAVSQYDRLQIVVSQYERLQAKERCQTLIQRYEEQRSASLRVSPSSEEKTAEPSTLSFDDITKEIGQQLIHQPVEDQSVSLRALPDPEEKAAEPSMLSPDDITKERGQQLIHQHVEEQSVSLRALPGPEEKTTERSTLSFDDITNLQLFIAELSASLESLPTVRKNCFAALFRISALNLVDRRRLEQQLADAKKKLNSSNAKEVPSDLARQINLYREILVANEGGKTGQSRYLASLDSFLVSRRISPTEITDDSIFKSFVNRMVRYT